MSNITSAENFQDLRLARACLAHGPESIGNILRLELLHLPVRFCAETLEDVRRLRACLGHGPERVGNLLRVEVLHLLGRCRAQEGDPLAIPLAPACP